MRKKAFTLIEMIFVIIVMGIVAGGTFVQISTIYEQMLQKQGSSELENQSKAIIEQITSRLSSAIKESIVTTNTLNTSDNCQPMSNQTSTTGDKVLIWVARSDESNTGLWDTAIEDYRGWSGFVDVNASDENTIYTRGSNISNAKTVIEDLTGKNFDDVAAIYFTPKGTQQSSDTCTIFYGTYTNEENHIYKVKHNTSENDRLDKNDKDFTNISEQYTLTHAAYAIKRESDGKLYLYEFRPWNSTEALSNNSTKYLLGKDVSAFGAKWEGGLFRINLCLEKNSTDGYPIRVCKEKAIF